MSDYDVRINLRSNQSEIYNTKYGYTVARFSRDAKLTDDVKKIMEALKPEKENE